MQLNPDNPQPVNPQDPHGVVGPDASPPIGADLDAEKVAKVGALLRYAEAVGHAMNCNAQATRQQYLADFHNAVSRLPESISVEMLQEAVPAYERLASYPMARSGAGLYALGNAWRQVSGTDQLALARLGALAAGAFTAALPTLLAAVLAKASPGTPPEADHCPDCADDQNGLSGEEFYAKMVSDVSRLRDAGIPEAVIRGAGLPQRVIDLVFGAKPTTGSNGDPPA